jgi:hypothetical protein
MQKKTFISFLIFLLFSNFLLAQNETVKSDKVSETYDRSGLTYLFLDFKSDRFSSYLRDAASRIEIPIKFDNNLLSFSAIDAPYFRDEHSGGDLNLQSNKYKIQDKLLQERVNYKLLEFWWGIKNDGSYSAQTIQQRGIYNATDIDVTEADASKIGRAQLGDAGEKLIGNSYILVYDVHSIKTMTEIYDEQDAAAKAKAEKDKTEFKPVKRTRNGYKGSVTAFLYRLAYNDTIQAYFFESFSDEKNIDLQKFNTIYNNVKVPLKFVSSTTASADGTQMNTALMQKTTSELFEKLLSDGVSSALSSFERSLEEFRVKTPLVSTFPIKAKVGKKEGLTTDRRFYVWEYQVNSKGETVAKHKAVVRSRMIHNNLNDELGKTGTTNFYQVSGGKLREGMILQERVDLGVAIGLGAQSYAGQTSFHIRAEGSLSQYLGYVINTPLTAFKLYADALFQKDKDSLYDLLGRKEYSFSRFSVGLNKEIYFARKFHVGILGGAGLEQATWADREGSESMNTYLITAGLEFGMAVGKNSQIVASLMNYSPIGDVTENDKDGELLNTYTEGWDYFFPERKGAAFDVTFRILF